MSNIIKDLMEKLTIDLSEQLFSHAELCQLADVDPSDCYEAQIEALALNIKCILMGHDNNEFASEAVKVVTNILINKQLDENIKKHLDD